MRGFIAIVEAAYDLDGDDESWLGKLSAAAAPTMDDGLGTMAWSFRWEDDVFGMHAIAATGPAQGMTQMPSRFADFSSSGVMDRTLRATGLAVATTSERTAAEEFRAIMDACAPPAVADFVAIQALDYLGRGVVLGVPLRKLHRLSPIERHAKERLAVHINAAFRLRCLLEQTPLLDSTHAEAVLENGVAVHATGPARSANARERLRKAALAVDRARALDDSDPVAAIEAWQGLVDGRWSSSSTVMGGATWWL